MTKREAVRAGWTKSLETLIASDREVRAWCDTYDASFVVVDLRALAIIKGDDYSYGTGERSAG